MVRAAFVGAGGAVLARVGVDATAGHPPAWELTRLWLLYAEALLDPSAFAITLRDGETLFSQYLRGQLSERLFEKSGNERFRSM